MTRAKCLLCALGVDRLPVLGYGNPLGGIMLIGEAPGRNEDKVGRPFIGAAGQVLDEHLKRVGLLRDDVYITNVVKCRPPDNRAPTKEEVGACSRILEREIELHDPKIIVLLGATAAKWFLKKDEVSMREIHGRTYVHKVGSKEVIIFYSYHPASQLYEDHKKYVIMADFIKLKNVYDVIMSGKGVHVQRRLF